MRKKIIRVRPVSKLDPKTLAGNSESVFRKVGNDMVLDVGKAFWQRLFSLDFDSLREGRASVLGWSEMLGRAMSGFAGIANTMCGPEEAAAYFRIFQSAADAFNRTNRDWMISLSNSVSHASAKFNSNDAALGWLKAFVKENGGDFWEFLRETKEKYLSVSNSIVVFEFFWPAELSQIFLLADGLRERGNTVIIDATRANEQSDFIQWIEKFRSHPEIFDFFDYYVVYQDYGKTLKLLAERIETGGDASDLGNVAYRNGEGAVVFSKPKNPPEDEIFRSFHDAYFASDRFVTRIGGKKSAYLRLFPYKCYWSSCFFCTINSTHLYDYRAGMEKYVSACVDFIEKYGLEYVFFGDEAIRAEDILLFAKTLLKRKIRVIYRFRTRFDEAYDDGACEILARSGARYCWIGLECASDRVSGLINKGHELGIEKKAEIIGNFDKHGIPFHNYAILGLPGETAEEMVLTHAFLKRNIENRSNYHCTPNIFGLNYGSTYAKHPEKFGIELIETGTENDFLRLRFEFKRKETFAVLQRKIAEDVHRLQFTSFFHPEHQWLPPVPFWEFIDRSGLYYHMKSFSRENPFRKKTVSDLSKEAILEKKFSIFPYLVRTSDGKLENLGTGYRIEIPKNREFSEWFDASRNVSDNFQEGVWKKILSLDDYVELVRTLTEKGFLILER